MQWPFGSLSLPEPNIPPFESPPPNRATKSYPPPPEGSQMLPPPPPSVPGCDGGASIGGMYNGIRRTHGRGGPFPPPPHSCHGVRFKATPPPLSREWDRPPCPGPWGRGVARRVIFGVELVWDYVATRSSKSHLGPVALNPAQKCVMLGFTKSFQNRNRIVW